MLRTPRNKYMKHFPAIFTTLLSCATLSARTIKQLPGHIVGYQNSTISQGLSRVSISMDAIHIFPTLGDVVHFYPPQSVVGDSVSFHLDGIRQEYTITSFDGTNYVLTATKRGYPDNIDLHGIPLLKSFDIVHKSAKNTEISSSGEANITDNAAQRPGFCIEYISSETGSTNSLQYGNRVLPGHVWKR